VQPKRINIYIWAMKDRENYGRLCMTGTAAACTTLAQFVERAVKLGKAEAFSLPETTRTDAEEIGRGFARSYRELVVDRHDGGGALPLLEIDDSRLSVKLSFSDRSLAEFLSVLDHVSIGSGDDWFFALLRKKRVSVSYWPCFGHVKKSAEPRNRFAE
jgi:hypothetical protein